MGMIDIEEKEVVSRRAAAEGVIRLGQKSLDAIANGTVRKGDPLQTAEVAGLLAVKRTASDVPHCHPIPITGADFAFDVRGNRVKVTCTVKAEAKTGVEMEALNGVTTALVTIWDMVKYLEKDDDGQYPGTAITDVRVTEKKKG